MPTVVVRPRALADLAEIWAYIAQQSADDSPDQADAFVDLVDSKFHSLSRRPGVGRRRPELSSDIRSLAIGRYVVFYLPLPRGIEVVRVLHGSRDIESIFENEPWARGRPGIATIRHIKSVHIVVG